MSAPRPASDPSDYHPGMDITQGLPDVDVQNQISSRAVPVVPHAAPPHAASERDIPTGRVSGYDPLTNPPAGNECD